MVFSVVIDITMLSILQSFINLLSKLLAETENLTILTSLIIFSAVVQRNYGLNVSFFDLIIP